MIQSITGVWKCCSFAILVEPHRNVEIAFKVGLWPVHKLKPNYILSISILLGWKKDVYGRFCLPFNSMNIIWKHDDFNLYSCLL